MGKWHDKATVQANIVLGVFLVISAFVAGLFTLQPKSEGGKEDYVRTQQADNEEDHTEQLKIEARDSFRGLQLRVLNVKELYEGIRDDYPINDATVVKVRTEAPLISQQLLRIDDDLLQEYQVVYKYGYAAALLLWAAQTEPSDRQAEMHASASELPLAKGFSEVERIREAEVQDLELLDWLEEKHIEEWLLYNKAIAMAMHSKVLGSVSWEEIELLLDRIPAVYLEKFPLNRNPALGWMCQNVEAAAASNYCRRFDE